MALDKDAFPLAAFRNVQNSGKDGKVMEPAIEQDFFIKKSIPETWKRLEGSRLYERLFVYILHP